MQKVSCAYNLVVSHASTIKILLTVNHALLRYGCCFDSFLGFRETNMQMRHGHGCNCTPKTSVVVQTSRRQDLCLAFSYFYNSFHFCILQEFDVDNNSIMYNHLVHVFGKFNKITAPGRGQRPDPKRAAYIVESKIALLGILHKTLTNQMFSIQVPETNQSRKNNDF